MRINIKKLLRDKDERNLLINIGLAFAVKGVAMLISLFSMPLYIKYFDNNEALGLWYTILSMLTWIAICDLGLGNGLRNRLTEALAVGDSKKSKELVEGAPKMVKEQASKDEANDIKAKLEEVGAKVTLK